MNFKLTYIKNGSVFNEVISNSTCLRLWLACLDYSRKVFEIQLLRFRICNFAKLLSKWFALWRILYFVFPWLCTLFIDYRDLVNMHERKFSKIKHAATMYVIWCTFGAACVEQRLILLHPVNLRSEKLSADSCERFFL